METPPRADSDGRLYACVRALYDSCRAELVNRKYYGRRLATIKHMGNGLDIVLALGTSSVVGAWALW